MSLKKTRMCASKKKWTRRKERESSPLLSHKSCARSTAPLIRNKCIFYVYVYGAYVNATHPPPTHSMYAKLTKIKRNLTRNSAHHLVYMYMYTQILSTTQWGKRNWLASSLAPAIQNHWRHQSYYMRTIFFCKLFIFFDFDKI